MTKTLFEQFANVRRVSTPIVVLRTRDAAAVAATITKELPDAPIMQWDPAAGFQARTKAGTSALATITEGQPLVLNAGDAMFMARLAPAQSILFVFNAHRLWSETPVMQAIWNLRDSYKARQAMIVLCTTPEANAPRELDSDVIVINDPLPSADVLASIIKNQCENARPALPVPTGDTLRKAVDAVTGLSAFVAEQSVAISLTRKGVNIDELRTRKRDVINGTLGAKVFSGPQKFSDIGGSEGLKLALKRELNAKRPIKVVVVFDEFEKSMAGASSEHVGDGGVAKDASQVTLTNMQDHGWRGVVLYGHPGAGKTEVAKAMGNEGDCLVILADLGKMKGGIVGESEARVRAFFDMVNAIAGEGGAFAVATCNSTGALTTEMRRRFKTGFYFVDLPDRDEKNVIWTLKMAKFDLPKQKLPVDTGWTGAEIENCCEKADNYGCSLIEAAKSIVPVSTSQPELIMARRREASGRMLSASSGETFAVKEAELQAGVPDTSKAFIAPTTVRSIVEMPES